MDSALDRADADSSEEKNKPERWALDIIPAVVQTMTHLRPGHPIAEDTRRIVNFSTYGSACFDTPVFEHEDSGAGGAGNPIPRKLSHVPVGKVYRRDSPVMDKGRRREFTPRALMLLWDPMIHYGELVSLLCTILMKLDVDQFTIKASLFTSSWILPTITECSTAYSEWGLSSAVEGLDKLPWADLKLETSEEKEPWPDDCGLHGECVKSAKQAARNSSLSSKSMPPYATSIQCKLRSSEPHGHALPSFKGLRPHVGIIYEAVMEAHNSPRLKAANIFTSASLSD
ncbi:hypothetical protein NLJ89_g7165 [Agrocybe chaxingu]|uniref:Uncharacterized protein n=1 Tax=Agrocybe chaxingu TaxID=84603 RepID=A0A9W8JXB5_9AGAR|nr:hypothetical protein NLJ89_g7165 [Agrocybe chaxingu]